VFLACVAHSIAPSTVPPAPLIVNVVAVDALEPDDAAFQAAVALLVELPEIV